MSWLSALTGAAANYYGGSSGSSSGGSGFWGAVGNSVSDYFSSGSGWSDLLGGVMAGIGGAAQAGREDDQNRQSHEWALALEALRGDQQRRSSLFEMQLEDFYKQRDKRDKRVNLDTFGQFSVQSRRTPGYTPTPLPGAPVMPSLEDVANGS